MLLRRHYQEFIAFHADELLNPYGFETIIDYPDRSGITLPLSIKTNNDNR